MVWILAHTNGPCAPHQAARAGIAATNHYTAGKFFIRKPDTMTFTKPLALASCLLLAVAAHAAHPETVHGCRIYLSYVAG